MESLGLLKRASRQTVLLAAGVLTVCLITVPLKAQQAFRPVRVLEAQPAITKFATKPVQDVANGLNPSELVLGVTVGKESRAYPINMLTGPSREILNDTLGGQAIAATW